MKTLDPRNYYFRHYDLSHTDGPFAFMKQDSLFGRGVEEVQFDEEQLEQLDYDRNNISFSYYGFGRVDEHAAMLLDDGSILFCIVRGMRFAGTFQSSDNIRMEYYLATPIVEKPPRQPRERPTRKEKKDAKRKTA